MERYSTKGVADEMKENPAFAQEVIAAFNHTGKMTGRPLSRG